MRLRPRLWRACALAVCLAFPGPGRAEPPLAAVTVVGPPDTVFARKDACDGHDVPDTAARAYRDADGRIVLFAMHYENRALRGPDFDRLKLDCRVVLGSGGKGDPAAYDDRSWITATWTEDGRAVAALVHHEFQAHHHPGRCRFEEYMACWYNTVLAVASTDGGLSFPRPRVPQVVASAPFPQDVDQGRHRGFLNPSNIFSDGRFAYFFAATTGWKGQPYGACLAVFQASADGERFPQPGFYTTSSRDLLVWDKPRLLLAGKTLYDDPCGAGVLLAYPSLIDRDAKGRNFDDVGDEADLYFTRLQVEGCRITSDRDLLRRRVAIKVF